MQTILGNVSQPALELTKAMDHPEGPEKFESRLPVHQDGTCNGLPALRALGGDIAGAKQVNLRGGDRPSDVTLPWRICCASYLAKQIMASIGDLFSGADAIQTWLKESALLIAKSIPPERLDEVDNPKSKQNAAATAKQLTKEQMTSVIWTTPWDSPSSALPQGGAETGADDDAERLHPRPLPRHPGVTVKAGPALPPNFIHSLDATHMFLTALECQSAELTFASVHDSYWTHACDIETMSDIIRDTFVRLHSYDLLQKLADR
ncbi:hypothetical protein L7F22_052016 [Adiantum nelumboides]|nr:hypothetical protein [Adiantum nelumboides]